MDKQDLFSKLQVKNRKVEKLEANLKDIEFTIQQKDSLV